ncbi:uncharacterized protein LOC116142101 [Pistacia vera]|uniref:uncharacterized protein LOC116142101 n=1 Tax=Pistacia vera TaxID=55513 RepID=UPI0012638C55|nr:uncharacterized protein LOC116142101 [Pistacia vera]
MEKFVKEFSADIKTATEGGRKKFVAVVSTMKTTGLKVDLKKPKVFKNKKHSNKSSKSDEAISTRTNESEDMIQIDHVESPPSVYLRIDSTDDDGVNLEPSEQQINEDGLKSEYTMTAGIIDHNSEVGTSSLSEESRSVDVGELEDVEKNNPEKDMKKDHSAQKVGLWLFGGPIYVFFFSGKGLCFAARKGYVEQRFSGLKGWNQRVVDTQ